MERLEYEDDTLPRHVAHFFRDKKREEAIRVLDQEEARTLGRMDDRRILILSLLPKA